jgi:ATP-binding cassette subfamily F protein uup
VRLAHLSQELAELDPGRRVLETVEEIRTSIQVGKREWTASQLLERLGFRGDAQWKVIGDLSGGERRRLQLLRLLMDDPNVLLLDEPTNDLDIETLNELEDLLDAWPGTLILVSHDRYFLERVTDRSVALLGDGRLSLLPGGVDEYLERRSAGTALTARATSPAPAAVPERAGAAPAAPELSTKELREAQKELSRLERRLERIGEQEATLHTAMARSASDYGKLAEMDAELKDLAAQRESVEHEWMELAERLER